VDLGLPPGEHVLRGDVADRAVQADIVVMLDLAARGEKMTFEMTGGLKRTKIGMI
jgi:hypothetical protein